MRTCSYFPTLRRASTPTWLCSLAGSVLPLTVLGCASEQNTQRPTVISEPAPLATRPAPSWDPGDRPVTEAIFNPSAASAQDGAQVVGRHKLSAPPERIDPLSPAAIESRPGETVRLQYATRGADVADVMRVLLHDYLKRDYILDPKVTGMLTLDIDEEMSRADLLDLVSGLAMLNGWAIEDRAGVLFIRPADKIARTATAPVLQARPAVESESPVVRVRRVRYTAPDQLATLMKDLMSEGAKAVVAGRTIVMADTARQVARMSRLLSAVDVPAFDGVEVWTYRLVHRRPEDATKLMETVATGSLLTSGAEPLVTFLAVPNSDRMLVIAKDSTLQPQVRDLIREIDQPVGREGRHNFVYRIQYYAPQALLKLLTDFYGDKIEKEAKTDAEPRIRLALDQQSDSMLISATPTDYANVLATLKAVDRAPQQVVIQSIIAEVRLTNALAFGVEYFLQNKTDLGSLALTGSVPLAANAAVGGSAFFIGGSGFAVIQALDRESSANILSQPKLTLVDRAKGSIQVGGEVPTIKASEGSGTQTGGTSDIREEIEYRKTGVILDIEPQINESGMVTLKIRQEVTASIPTTVPNQPEFTTRNIETTVVVPSGSTVLLGGIINTDKRTEDNYIPLLGRIPLVGEAFKHQNDTHERTELLLTITPTIVNQPGDGRRLLSDFSQSIFGVRSLLNEFIVDLPRGSLQSMIEQPSAAPLGVPPPSESGVPGERSGPTDAPSAPEEPPPATGLAPTAPMSWPSSAGWGIFGAAAPVVVAKHE